MHQKYMMLTEVLLYRELQASCTKCFSKAKVHYLRHLRIMLDAPLPYSAFWYKHMPDALWGLFDGAKKQCDN